MFVKSAVNSRLKILLCFVTSILPPSLRILNPSKIQSAKFEWSDFCNRNFGDYLDSSLVLTPPKGSTTQQKKFHHFNLQFVAA